MKASADTRVFGGRPKPDDLDAIFNQALLAKRQLLDLAHRT